MRQVTKEEVLDVITAKRKSAEKAFIWAHIEGPVTDIEKNRNYMDAYQDVYCYIDSVDIMPKMSIKRINDAIIKLQTVSCDQITGSNQHRLQAVINLLKELKKEVDEDGQE